MGTLYYNRETNLSATVTNWSYINSDNNHYSSNIGKYIISTASNASFYINGVNAVAIILKGCNTTDITVYRASISAENKIDGVWKKDINGLYDFFAFNITTIVNIYVQATNSNTKIGSLYVYKGSTSLSRNIKNGIDTSITIPNETKNLYNGKRVSTLTGPIYREYSLSIDTISTVMMGNKNETDYFLTEVIPILQNEPCLLYISPAHVYFGQILNDADLEVKKSSNILNTISFTLTEIV
jgi:hypothetical protein